MNLPKLQQLLRRVKELKGESPAARLAQSLIDEVGASATRNFNEGRFPAALEKLATEFNDYKEYANVEGIVTSIKEADERNTASFTEYANALEEKVASLLEQMAVVEQKGEVSRETALSPILSELNSYRLDFEVERSASLGRSESFTKELAALQDFLLKEQAKYATIDSATVALTSAELATKRAEELALALEDLRREILGRIQNIGHGGNMNRSIVVGGDQNTLSKWTDINLKAGAGVTITYSANNATQYTDITISATGGGGGITRSINNVSTPTVMGNTAGIDYVYIVSGNTTVTLPTAVGNTNLMTVKNVGTGTVTVNTTGGQTIDNDSSVIMPVRYTSVDLISDGVNWNIT